MTCLSSTSIVRCLLDGRQLTVADVPGLLEGASDGVGLGHAFLAHLERAFALVHVVAIDPETKIEAGLVLASSSRTDLRQLVRFAREHLK